MRKIDLIRKRLEATFDPQELRWWTTAKATGATQDTRKAAKAYNVRIRAAAFEGQSRIQRHRAVHAALGADLLADIHALALDIGTPS